jgi:hypothetical protein
MLWPNGSQSVTYIKEERLDYLSHHVAYLPAMGDLTMDDQLIAFSACVISMLPNILKGN